MEQFVLGIFQEQLSKIIVGFRKEQVNASLLNGKGEITDVSLNCAFLNQAVSRVSPFIEFESIHVSKLGFHVTSWTNLRKAPILVDIEHVTAIIHEPLHFVEKSKRKKLQMITERELVEMILAGLVKPARGNGAYGFLDRILDNLTIDINSTTVEFQTWGRFKTRRVGPWTPPLLQIQFRHLRIVSVDEYGHEGTPEQIWAHNRHEHKEFMQYKKISMESHVNLLTTPNNSEHPIPLVKTVYVEVQAAVRRRLRDGAILAVQADVAIPEAEVEIAPDVIPVLAHLMAGMSYCYAKDRAYEDPLRSEKDVNPQQTAPSIKIDRQDSSDDDEEGDDDEKSEEKDDGSVSSSSTADEPENDVPPADDVPIKLASSHGSAVPKAPCNERPILLLPNGLVIQQSVSITFSIHHVKVRGVYPSNHDGHIELTTKGCIAELIWPKADKGKGLYGQLSVGYVCLRERHGRRFRTILLGGMQHDIFGPIETAGSRTPDIVADENFPLFERRSIREDPLDLRHSYPAQAVGVKSTIDFLKAADGSSNVMVLHEMGIDRFDIVLDSDSWCRAVRFALNEEGGGFEPRWYSGDWSEYLTVEMLQHPHIPLDLENHLQVTKQILLDDNFMISSDLFNVTARVTNTEVRIPAAVHENARSCDIVLKCDETMLVVSSALPRTFLSGKIGNSINGDNSDEKGLIDFPNDPTDIAYALEKGEDPATRLLGVETSKVISTFRFQLTLHAFQINTVPVIPFCNASEPQQLIAPADSTMIVCFEGEPPEPGSSFTKIALFISIQVYRFRINLDFDLLAGSASTLLYHTGIVKSTVECVKELLLSAGQPGSVRQANTPEESSKVKKSLRGRRIIIRHHLAQSRETGGLSVVFCLQQKELGLTVFRQNVPLVSWLRNPSTDKTKAEDFHKGHLSLLRLLDLTVNDFEIGVEFDFQEAKSRRTVLKCCLGEALLKVCDVHSVIEEYKSQAAPKDSNESSNGFKNNEIRKMVDILSFGVEELPGDSANAYMGQDQHFALRLEEQITDSRSWSLAADLTSPAIINLHVNEIKDTILLGFEALLLPTWSKRTIPKREGWSFPDKTIGALLFSLVPEPKASSKAAGNLWTCLEMKYEQNPADSFVERILRVLFQLFLPADLHLVLVRLEIGNLLVCVPVEEEDVRDRAKHVGLLLHQSDIVVRFYPVPGTKKIDIMDVLACKGIAWSSLIDTQEEGFYHKIICRQSLVSVSLSNIGKSDVLVNPFDVAFSYAAARISLSMNNQLQVEDIRKLEEFIWHVVAFSKCCDSFKAQLAVILLVMRRHNTTSSHDSASVVLSDDHRIDSGTLSTEVACSIRSGRNMLSQLHEELNSHDLHLRGALRDKEDEVDSLKRLVFSKEKERFGALALLSSRVAGWLRMGGLHRSGQRISKTSTMLPYWAVLRKQLLLLFKNPGEPRPSDVVLLRDAVIRRLAGGRNKQDVKRGFAIIESSGTTRFFVAASSSEFTYWVRELKASMNHVEGVEDISQTKDLGRDIPPIAKGLDAEESQEEDPSTMESGAKDLNGRNRKNTIGSRLASAINTARLKGGEVTENRRLNSDFGSEHGEGKDETNRARGTSDASSSTNMEQNTDNTRPALDSIEPGEHLGDDLSVRDGPESNLGVVDNRAPGYVYADSFDPQNDDGDFEGTDDSLDQGDNLSTEPTRRIQFGKKIAGVGQVTKSKIGSALQKVTLRQRSSTADDSSETSLDREGNKKGDELSSSAIHLGNHQLASHDEGKFSDEFKSIPASVDSSEVESTSTAPRNRLGLGNRLGSALQTARQKGKEVTERRKSNVENTAGKAQPRARLGLRGRLTGLAQERNNAGADNDATETFSWSCGVCTFLNYSEIGPSVSNTCQMCGTACMKIVGSQSSLDPVELFVSEESSSEQAKLLAGERDFENMPKHSNVASDETDPSPKDSAETRGEEEGDAQVSSAVFDAEDKPEETTPPISETPLSPISERAESVEKTGSQEEVEESKQLDAASDVRDPTASADCIAENDATEEENNENSRGNNEESTGIEADTCSAEPKAFSRLPNESGGTSEKNDDEDAEAEESTPAEDIASTVNNADTNEGLDTSLSNRSPLVSFDPSFIPEDANIEGVSWSCGDCTFMNNVDKQTLSNICDMCGSPRVKGIESKSGFASAEPELNGDETQPDTAFDEAGLADQGSRRGIRARFGLGGMNARANKSEQRTLSSQNVNSRKSGRFSFRKRSTDDASEPIYEGGSVSLKNIRTGHTVPPASVIEPPETRTPPILKKLQGRWIVVAKPSRHFSVSAPDESHGAAAAKANETGVPHSDPSNGDSSDGISNWDDGTRTAINKAIDGSEVNPVEEKAQSNSSGTATRLPDFKNTFYIQVFRGDSSIKEPSGERLCRLTDILKVHAEISEQLEQAMSQIEAEGMDLKRTASGEMGDCLAVRLGLSSFDNVLVTGRILGGLLDLDPASEIVEKTHEYRTETIEAFLNYSLESPLPVGALAALTELLGISADTEDAKSKLDFNANAAGDVEAKDAIGMGGRQISREEKLERPEQARDIGLHALDAASFSGKTSILLGLLSACETELSRAENHAINANAIVLKGPPPIAAASDAMGPIPSLYEPLLPPSVTEGFHDAMHEALMRVMAERDDARATLVASKVLHVHELEQERKINQRLTQQLKVAEALTRERVQMPQLPDFFQQKSKKPEAEAKAMMHNYELEIKKNNDAEITEISQQLASEVAQKTSHALEVKRMKETREIERKYEADEAEALKVELKRVKEILAVEQSKINKDPESEKE